MAKREDDDDDDGGGGGGDDAVNSGESVDTPEISSSIHAPIQHTLLFSSLLFCHHLFLLPNLTATSSNTSRFYFDRKSIL